MSLLILSGIGLMITTALALNGARRVYIVGRRVDVLQQAALSIDPEVVMSIPGDVTSEESLLAIVARVEADIGYINLIANAGVMCPRPLKTGPDDPLPSIAEYRAHALKTPMKDFTSTYAVNATSVHYTALAFLELLDAGNKRNPDLRSQIIATSSIGRISRLAGASFAYSTQQRGQEPRRTLQERYCTWRAEREVI
jgi:NAD(P)-dependent dehydrogenase (short-subunit alcohol dehydrogenase family)